MALTPGVVLADGQAPRHVRGDAADQVVVGHEHQRRAIAEATAIVADEGRPTGTCRGQGEVERSARCAVEAEVQDRIERDAFAFTTGRALGHDVELRGSEKALHRGLGPRPAPQHARTLSTTPRAQPLPHPGGLREAAHDPDPSRILAVGDGIATDIRGGLGEGIDTLFVTGGLAADEFGRDVEAPDAALLADWLARQETGTTFAIGRLR